MKKIKNYSNYSINEDGIVINNITGKVKRTYVNSKNGYLYVDLWKNNKKRQRPIHRLIAETFIPNPENKLTVDHIDANRTNNKISNLRWATYSEQNKRISQIGVRSEPIKVTRYHEERRKRGGGHISWGQIIETMEFEKITDVANYFGLTIGNISLLLKNGSIGRRGKTRGYKFEYLKNKRVNIKKRVTTNETD